ncbi:hypothetical protein ACLMAJ_21640 [Nocardia sp. KC 131]|uniref:hypothetical protein n=1 Tax=Nocardia arseniciresistens TaxID=3392119 RepID=UPI00398F775F
MTDPRSSTPNDPAGESPEHSGGEQFAARPGQHESPDPQSPDTGAGHGHGRHEMAGTAGYPQFEGPGAAQYGSEPVEPPPPVAPTPHAAGPPQQPQYQPTYGPPGTGPAGPPPGMMQPEPGTAPPQPGMAQSYPGAMPPPPSIMPTPPGGPQPTYGYQVAGDAPRSLDVGNALSYGWEKFRANPLPWLGATAVGVLIYLAFVIVVRFVNPTSMLPVLLIFLAVMVGIWLLQAALVRGALYETDGNKPVFGSYFHFINAGNVLLTALLAFVLTGIGFALCVLPGLIAGFLCMFALHYVVDQDLGPLAAIKASATLVVTNIAPVLLLGLAVMVLTFVGAILCGLGLFIAAPVATIAVTYAYRTLTGGIVA